MEEIDFFFQFAIEVSSLSVKTMFRLKSNLPIMEIELTSLRPRFPEATFSIPFSFVSSGCNAEMKTYRHGMQEKHASFRYEITAECKFSNGNYRYNFCERM